LSKFTLLGNHGPGGGGAVLTSNGTSIEICGGEASSTTNNRMENSATIHEAVKEPFSALAISHRDFLFISRLAPDLAGKCWEQSEHIIEANWPRSPARELERGQSINAPTAGHCPRECGRGQCRNKHLFLISPQLESIYLNLDEASAGSEALKFPAPRRKHWRPRWNF
jgi:hypothetical protein